jgi:hypothetical protein
MTSEEQVRQLKKILDALVKAEKADNNTREVIHDNELSKLPSLIDENILNAVKDAIGDNPKRRNVSVFVFAELYNVEGIEQVFSELLSSSDPHDKIIILQIIGHRQLKKFVPLLNNLFFKETNVNCKEQLITTLGTLADQTSFPIFLSLIQTADRVNYWRLVWALRNFGRPEGKPFLERVFKDKKTDTSDKVVAAWGLVKTGERKYYDYLVKMLDDPDIKTPNSYSPGQSLRAAQAICDIHNWDFIWSSDYVPVVKDRLKNVS